MSILITRLRNDDRIYRYRVKRQRQPDCNLFPPVREHVREEVGLTLRLISVCFEQRGSNCDLFLPAAVLGKQRLQCY